MLHLSFVQRSTRPSHERVIAGGLQQGHRAAGRLQLSGEGTPATRDGHSGRSNLRFYCSRPPGQSPLFRIFADKILFPLGWLNGELWRLALGAMCEMLLGSKYITQGSIDNMLCLQKHEITTADDVNSGHGDRLGWQPWSSPVISKASAIQRGAAVATALLADVSSSYWHLCWDAYFMIAHGQSGDAPEFSTHHVASQAIAAVLREDLPP